MEDVLGSLGYLTLGSRLRRIGERLQATTQSYLSATGIAVPAAQLPLLAALDRHDALTVGELAQALRQSQPGITRMVDKLQQAGLVKTRREAGDQRLRRLTLSAAGKRLLAHAKGSVWPVIEQALASHCGQLQGDLLAQLTAFEAALVDGSIQRRLVATGQRKNARASA